MTRIHAHNGALIAEYARERRIFVPINTIPKRVIAAFLSAEDKRFYEHGGVDFQGIARAVYKVVESKIEGSDRRAEGGSTITQQVAKNFLLSSERSMERKLKEAILAIRIERAYSKDKILELYLNEIYFGIGAYGIAAASLSYFNKELQDLTHRGGRVSGGAPQGAQQLSSVPAREAGADPPRLDHRPDAGERLHHGRGGGDGQEQAARRQPSPDRRAHLRRRLLRRGGAAHAAVAVRRGQALQRRPVGAHDARPAAAAGGAPLADGRPRAVRSDQGLARPGDQARHRRRLGQSPRRRRASARHSALAAGRGSQDGSHQGGDRSAAGEAAGRLAGRQTRGRRDRLR